MKIYHDEIEIVLHEIKTKLARISEFGDSTYFHTDMTKARIDYNVSKAIQENDHIILIINLIKSYIEGYRINIDYGLLSDEQKLYIVKEMMNNGSLAFEPKLSEE